MRSITFWPCLFLTLISLGFSTSSYSACNFLSGLYVGAGIGNTFSNLDVDFSSSTGASFSKKLTDSKAQGNFFVGYGRLLEFSPVYLGGEVSIYTPSLKRSLERSSLLFAGQTFTDTIKLTNYFNVDFTPGYVICNRFMIYGRVGYGMNNLKFSQANANGIDEHDFNHNNDAWRAGAGISYRFCANLKADIDYVYSQSHSSFNAHPLAQSPQVEANYDIKPSTNFLGFRLSYIFL